MARKVKPAENQISLLNTPDLQPSEDQEYHEGRETQKAERLSAPDDDPVLMQWRDRFMEDHCRKYPGGLCAYFRYDFGKVTGNESEPA